MALAFRAMADSRRRSAARLSGLGLVVYNLIYWPYLLTTIAILFLLVVVVRLVTFWDRRYTHALTSAWAAHYLGSAPFAGVEVEGREAAPRGGCIFVSNHQSMVDILAVYATNLPYLWVSKRENFWVPFLGWTMWVNGYVALRRRHLPSIFKMLRTCERHLKLGRSLFVFPEGTRSPDGNLIPFYRGAFWMSARYRVPIVPVVIEGTGGILPKKQLFISPRPVTVRILPAIDPSVAGYDSRRLRDLVHERMAAELEALRAELGGRARQASVDQRAA
jgi:1-acyl-sn-glycerol-3-phosphate acyltransferase